MNRKLVLGALLIAGAVSGCNGSKPTYTHASGSLALSNDGSTVYAVDTDNNSLLLANAQDGSPMGQVAVGKSPARVTVGPDDRVYVSNMGERTVSVIARDSHGQLAETSRISVDVEPVGLSLTPDGKQLLVVSATSLNDPTQGTLTAIDTTSLTAAWKTTVGEEPRGVAVVGQTAYVTNLKQGTVTTVSLQTHASTGTINLNNSDDPNPENNPTARTVGAATELTPSADGSRLYVAHAWQVAGSIATAGTAPVAEGGGGTYGGGGGPTVNNAGGIVSAGLGTVQTSSNTAKADSFVTAPPSPDGKTVPALDYPRSALALNGGASQGASAVVVEPTGTWVFVANKLSNNVLVLPTDRQAADPDPTVIPVAAGPDGLALSADGKTLYVYSQFDHTLSLITSGGGSNLQVSQVQPLAVDTLPADQVAGRKMFFSAIDSRMTSPAIGLACASCHLDGREDGHVWQFPDGKRQTPGLAGRHIELTAPYHWASIFPTLNEFFTETIVGRMGGAGSAENGLLGLNQTDSSALQAFIEGMPAPENPLQNRPDLSATIASGQQAFHKATCDSCHSGQAMTDNQIHNVGTLHSDDLLEIIGANGIGGDPSSFPPLPAVNTPSLLGLGRTAPYLHDGTIQTVSARIAQAGSPNASGVGERHGDTSQLSVQELADLQTYLLSL